MNAIKFCEESVFLIMNFVKICFSNVEFCEMSKIGLNFPPRQTPDITKHYLILYGKKSKFLKHTDKGLSDHRLLNDGTNFGFVVSSFLVSQCFIYRFFFFLNDKNKIKLHILSRFRFPKNKI